MKPALDLSVEVEIETGQRFRWDANASDPGDRPQNITFKTRIGDGFAEGGAQLRRKAQVTYPDLGKLATHRYIGADGSVAYEGRAVRFPTGAGSVTAEAAGWMSHAQDRQCTFLGVDRDLSRWGPVSTARRANLLAASYTVDDPQADQGFSGAELRLRHAEQWAAPIRPICEAVYDAGPRGKVAKVWVSYNNRGTASGADANWGVAIGLTDSDAFTNVRVTPDLWGTATNNFYAPDGGGTPGGALVGAGRYGYMQWLYAASPGGAQGQDYQIGFQNLAVYGDHGLPLIGATEPKGLLASDIIKYTAARYAPLIDASQITPTSQVIDQIVFDDLITPYDLWRKVNSYERRNLAVWEDRRLYYDPIDTSTPDWIIRTDEGAVVNIDDPGGLGGYNGAIVRFQNVSTSAADLVSPDTNPELADTNPDLPANRYAIAIWAPVQLPDPNSPAGAVKIGQALLAEVNRKREPGTAVIRGHIRDSASNLQQGWKVRAGQTVSVEDFPDDRPRLIHETQWDQQSKTQTMTLDAADQTPEAALDQIIGNRGTIK